jgi:hypothetical protein
MTSRGSKIGDKQERAIAALLSEPTHALAAQKAGVSLSTIQRWLRQPAFMREYRRHRTSIVEAAVAKLQAGGDRAVSALLEALECDHAPTRVRAACALLDYAMRGVELCDLDSQVAELNKRMDIHNERKPFAEYINHEDTEDSEGDEETDPDEEDQPGDGAGI